MYRIYFKQALLMLKQNKFISAIAIIGTALAIMMIMTIIVADEIKRYQRPTGNKQGANLTYQLPGKKRHDKKQLAIGQSIV